MFKESFQEVWQARYGVEPTLDFSPIEPFLRHRSVRQFSSRSVEESLVHQLMAAAQSAATSSYLQLWSVISVQESEKRKAIADLCGGQSQILEAPWFFAFLADVYRVQRAALEVGENPAGLDYMEFMVMSIVDASLAAERMVCAAESMGLGVCYIGALRNNVYGVQELLNLPKGVFGVFGLCLGWPLEGSTPQIKPRFSQKSIWFRETYNYNPDIREFDKRMANFYKSQGGNIDLTWSRRSGRRVSGYQMTGREALKAWLEKQGFGLR